MSYRIIGQMMILMFLMTAAVFGQNVFELQAEPNHSTIGFSVKIAGMTRITGKFKDYIIHIVYNEEDIVKSSVYVRIKAKSINTGIDDRDKDLQGETFFDAAKYPEIIFKSKTIKKQGDGYVAAGDFTMRGVTKEIELPFVLKITRNSKNKPTLGISARLTINRQDYGVGTAFRHSLIPDFISDEVSIEIDMWTRVRKKK